MNDAQGRAAAKLQRLGRLCRAIRHGEWAEVERLCTKSATLHYRQLLFAVYRQQYLEMVERQEYQMAFSFLNKRLKPLETLNTVREEMRDLCYLLTCRTVQEVPRYRAWVPGAASREALVAEFRAAMGGDALLAAAQHSGRAAALPPRRLLHLVSQAVRQQGGGGGRRPPAASLLRDYVRFLVPNAPRATLAGHAGSVTGVRFAGEAGAALVSCSGDRTLRVWDTASGRCRAVLEGHAARVWEVACSASGRRAVSASADGTLRLWDLGEALERQAAEEERARERREQREEEPQEEARPPPLRVGPSGSFSTASRGSNDLYGCDFHPRGTHVVCGGYERSVRLFDVETQKAAGGGPMRGHTDSVTSVVFNPMGNLAVSGSNDKTVRFWDLLSGVCVQAVEGAAHMGEVTSVEVHPAGTMMLTACKDNWNRLWDIRHLRAPLGRFRGHLNATKNFVRATFGPERDGELVVVGGSECGRLHLWDCDGGGADGDRPPLETLDGHAGVVFGAAWNERTGVLASCSGDFTVRTWAYDEGRDAFFRRDDGSGGTA